MGGGVLCVCMRLDGTPHILRDKYIGSSNCVSQKEKERAGKKKEDGHVPRIP